MRNRFIFLIAVCMLILLSITAFAHSGGTDEYYGHYDHSTGEYHYHHGYAAHQHSGGSCPYDTDGFDVVEYVSRREIDNAWKEIENEWERLEEYEQQLIEEDRRISEERLQLDADKEKWNSGPSKVLNLLIEILLHLLPIALILALASPLVIWIVCTIKMTFDKILEKIGKKDQ